VRAPIAAPAPADRRGAPRWPLLLAALAVVLIGIAAAIALMFAPLQRVVSPDSPAPIVESLTAREPQPSPIAPTRAPRPPQRCSSGATLRPSAADACRHRSQRNPVSYPANVADGETTAWQVDGGGGGAWIERVCVRVRHEESASSATPRSTRSTSVQPEPWSKRAARVLGRRRREATAAQRATVVELPAPVRALGHVVILETYPPPRARPGATSPISEVAVRAHGTLAGSNVPSVRTF
jgi:hypothetical protein